MSNHEGNKIIISAISFVKLDYRDCLVNGRQAQKGKQATMQPQKLIIILFSYVDCPLSCILY